MKNKTLKQVGLKKADKDQHYNFNPLRPTAAVHIGGIQYQGSLQRIPSKEMWLFYSKLY